MNKEQYKLACLRRQKFLPVLLNKYNSSMRISSIIKKNDKIINYNKFPSLLMKSECDHWKDFFRAMSSLLDGVTENEFKNYFIFTRIYEDTHIVIDISKVNKIHTDFGFGYRIPENNFNSLNGKPIYFSSHCCERLSERSYSDKEIPTSFLRYHSIYLLLSTLKVGKKIGDLVSIYSIDMKSKYRLHGYIAVSEMENCFMAKTFLKPGYIGTPEEGLFENEGTMTQLEFRKWQEEQPVFLPDKVESSFLDSRKDNYECISIGWKNEINIILGLY